MSANDPKARWPMTALAQTTKPSAARSDPKPYAGNCQNLFGRVFLAGSKITCMSGVMWVSAKKKPTPYCLVVRWGLNSTAMCNRRCLTGIFYFMALMLSRTAVLFAVLTLSTVVSAETRSVQSADKPIVVQVGIELNQIIDIDQKAESFKAEYTFRLRYREPRLAFERAPDDPPYRMMTVRGFLTKLQEAGLIWPDIVLANKQGVRAINLENIQVYPDGEVQYYERATAAFQAPDFDFRNFPFDVQDFYIRVVSMAPKSTFVFESLPGTTGIGDQLGEQEWVLVDSWSKFDTIIGVGDQEHSRFSLAFKAHRHVLYYIVRIFVPMLVILMVSWLTFRMKDYVKRVDLGITVLLLLIAFNFTLGSDLPRLGYLTFVDVFIVGTFLITAAVIALNIQLRVLEIQDRNADAARLDRIAMLGYWPAYVLGMSAALLLI